ncbi:MAG: FtsX-like permease family protein [Flavobacteriaceae bacterium]|nr:FtsX-like permease family protein [Flavobacteriaceae bacterium]
MINFLIKGILRDRTKSLIPICVITIGVSITVFMAGFIKGVMSDFVSTTAKLDSGHLKIMTKPYYENKDQIPNDLAILNLSMLTRTLDSSFPNLKWVPRIKFGGILDVPDKNGETILQGPGIGLGIHLFDKSKGELARLSINKSLIRGSIPNSPDEIILSESFSRKLKVNPGDLVTYFGATMEGSMVFESFKMSGTVNFGNPVLDKSTFIIDFNEAQKILDMENGTGELLGFFNNDIYDDVSSLKIEKSFNASYENSSDEFAPIMVSLRNQNDLGSTIDLINTFSSIFIFIFVLAMSMVLWNTGLIGGLRRFQEFGIRLAIGESKRHVYFSLLTESFFIGLIGSSIGTFLGVSFCYYMQENGIDISAALENSAIIFPSVLKAEVTPDLFYIGFIPGLLSMVFGSSLSGRGIFRRNTANLFKELEV